MKDGNKTKGQLINELVELRQRITELEKSEAERKRAEEALRQSEKKYRQLVENLQEGIWVIDKDARTIFVNPHMANMLGYTVEEMIGKHLFSFMDESWMEICKRNLERCQQGIKEHNDFEFLRKDRTRILTTLETAPIIDDNGDYIGAIAGVIDVTEHKRTVEAIKESEERYRNLFENAHDMIQSVSSDGHFIFVNPAWLKTMGYTRDDLQKITIFDILHPSCIPHCMEAFQKVMSKESINSVEAIFISKDGRQINVEGNVSARLIGGVVVASHGIFRDITERKRSEEEMKKLSLAVEESSDWILIADREGNIEYVEYVNKAVVEITGYQKEELIGQNPSVLKSGKHDAQFYRELWDTILSGRTFRAIITNRKKNGKLFDIYHTITPLIDSKGNITHFVATSKDLTQQKLLEERLNYIAYHDVLTALPNRTLFIDRLNQTIARAEYNKRLVAVLSIDIDRFTLINDSLGPEIGDEVLKEVGRRLSGSVREGDTVARIGSDEFGISLVDVAHSEDVILVVEKIMMDVHQPLKVKGEEIIITLSIGISVYPGDGKDTHTLVKNADIAMSKAKASGMNNYQFFTTDMNIRASEFVLMERHLFNAIRNNEFILYYQPYWETNTKKTAGMEALLRWNSAELGLMTPGKFIPVLEETGMIIDVGKWIINTVCKQVKEWREKGYTIVPITVNLSSVQFRQKDLVEMLEGFIKESGIDSRFLALEITESTFMQDIEFTRAVFERLKKSGISINIDDFGTGYSSLSYLKRLPVDNLKIDSSFIREIATNPDDASIVTTIITMAHNLGLKTIAEGVETEE